MGASTPDIDRIARDGVIITDCYAQASCTAGRAAFTTGQIPMRAGLTMVGMPGAPQGIQAEESDTGRAAETGGLHDGLIGKDHLGDRYEFFPTVHGFEFYATFTI